MGAGNVVLAFGDRREPGRPEGEPELLFDDDPWVTQLLTDLVAAPDGDGFDTVRRPRARGPRRPTLGTRSLRRTRLCSGWVRIATPEDDHCGQARPEGHRVDPRRDRAGENPRRDEHESDRPPVSPVKEPRDR